MTPLQKNRSSCRFLAFQNWLLGAQPKEDEYQSGQQRAYSHNHSHRWQRRSLLQKVPGYPWRENSAATPDPDHKTCARGTHVSREGVGDNRIQSRNSGIAEELDDDGKHRKTTQIRSRTAKHGNRYGIYYQNSNGQRFQAKASSQQTEDKATGGAPKITHCQDAASL